MQLRHFTRKRTAGAQESARFPEDGVGGLRASLLQQQPRILAKWRAVITRGTTP